MSDSIRLMNSYNSKANYRFVKTQEKSVSNIFDKNPDTNFSEKTVQKNDLENINKKNNKASEESQSGLSKGMKWAIGIGLGITALATLPFLLKKGISNKYLSSLYSKKLILTKLPEHLDFKEAKNLEEGLRYTKEVLKIKNVDERFSLDAINYVNRRLVDVSNANKGKLFMPPGLRYEQMDNAIASVNKNIFSTHFGELTINKNYFDNEFLTKQLTNYLGLEKNIAKEAANKGSLDLVGDNGFLSWAWDKRVSELANRFKKSPASLSVNEKRDLLNNLNEGTKLINNFQYLSPYSAIAKNINLFKAYGINVNLEEIKKLSTTEQQQKLKDLFLEISQITGQRPVARIRYTDVDSTIYHEMGHLQDYVKNLKTNHLAGKVGNRWGTIAANRYKNLLDTEPRKFKKLYPDMYSHVSDEKIQQIAGKVSWYAQSGIGEFVAEVYAKLIKGEEIADDVLTLYKKYNGPMISFS